MTIQLIQPFKESRPLLTFTLASSLPEEVPQVICATTWTSPLQWRGRVYSPEPAIKVELPAQTGGMNEDPIKVTLPLRRAAVNPEIASLAAMLASSRACPRVHLEVAEIKADGASQVVIFHGEGEVTRARSNPAGNSGVVEVDVEGELRRGMADLGLGRRCDPQCDVVFGGTGCGNPRGFGNGRFGTSEVWVPSGWTGYRLPRSAYVDLTVSTDNGRVVTIKLAANVYTSATDEQRLKTLTEQPADWWIGSFIKAGGVSIPIQSVNKTNGTFTLSRLPPKSWDGARVFLQLDCPRDPESCFHRFLGSYSRFNGLSYGMPAYNPSIDLPN